MEKLTLEQAKQQGYTDYVYNSDGFQRIKSLDYPDEIDWTRNDIFLVEKESYNPSGIDSETIAELLAEHVYCNHVDNTGDDTDDVYDALKELDFTDAEKKIDEVLSKLNYYRASKIQLIS